MQGSADMLCGYYCLWMLRVAFGGEAEYQKWCDELARSASSNKKRLIKCAVTEGMTKRQLRNLLEADGLVDRRNTWKRDGWAAAWEAIQERKPSLIWFRESAWYPDGHYVVVRGSLTSRRWSMLIVNDPLQGECWVSKAEFTSLKGNTLVCSRPLD